MLLVNCAIIAKFMKAKCQNILQNSTELLRLYPLYYVFMISMQYINHSINCVLYCIVGTKFREELIKLFKCQRKTSELSAINNRCQHRDHVTLSNIENISTMLSRRTFLLPWSSTFQITLIMPATFSTFPLDASQHRNICL